MHPHHNPLAKTFFLFRFWQTRCVFLFCVNVYILLYTCGRTKCLFSRCWCFSSVHVTLRVNGSTCAALLQKWDHWLLICSVSLHALRSSLALSSTLDPVHAARKRTHKGGHTVRRLQILLSTRCATGRSLCELTADESTFNLWSRFLTSWLQVVFTWQCNISGSECVWEWICVCVCVCVLLFVWDEDNPVGGRVSPDSFSSCGLRTLSIYY